MTFDLVLHAAPEGRATPNRVGVDPSLGLFWAANGAGSFEGGEPLALDAGLATFRDAFSARTGPDLERLHHAVLAAHEAMRRLGLEHEGREAQLAVADGAARSTDRPPVHFTASLTACCLRGGTLSVVGVGDDRAYLCRSGALRLLVPDDTSPRGDPDPQGADAANLPRNLVFQVLGGPTPVPHLTAWQVAPGDVVLLCTPEVWNRADGERRVRGLVDASGDDLRERVEEASAGDGFGAAALRCVVRHG